MRQVSSPRFHACESAQAQTFAQLQRGATSLAQLGQSQAAFVILSKTHFSIRGWRSIKCRNDLEPPGPTLGALATLPAVPVGFGGVILVSTLLLARREAHAAACGA